MTSVMKSWLKIKVKVIKKFQKKETGLEFNPTVRVLWIWEKTVEARYRSDQKISMMHTCHQCNVSQRMYPVSIFYSELSHSSLNKISQNFEATHPILVSLNHSQDVSISIFFSRIDRMVSILFVVPLLNYTYQAYLVFSTINISSISLLQVHLSPTFLLSFFCWKSPLRLH